MSCERPGVTTDPHWTHPSTTLLEMVDPRLAAILADRVHTAPLFEEAAIVRETVWVTMRDGIRLATDLYVPPRERAPAIAARTPYGRTTRSENLLWLAQRGYVAISQDCRGTGDSEPDSWEFMVYEPEDSFDFVEWVSRQEWFSGFLGSFGGSYIGATQWCMARHPAMSAIAPEVAGFGVSTPTTSPNIYMFANAYSRTVGKGADKVAVPYEDMERLMVDETLAGGYFNDPLYVPFSERLIERYPHLRSLSPSDGQASLYDIYRRLAPEERAELVKLALGEDSVTYEGMMRFGTIHCRAYGDGYLYPRASDPELFKSLHAPALLITGWYDWGLNRQLATWQLLTRESREPVRSRSRLLIAPSAHNAPGYHEGTDDHPELQRIFRTREQETFELLLDWYISVRNDALDRWPTVTYYLMGTNEWQTASAWPPPEAESRAFYLGPDGVLSPDPPLGHSEPDRYVYEPADPTPTVGGSIVSYVYTPGSADVAGVQGRPDVLTYTTDVLQQDLDVVGPLRVVLYASSSALDTDFVVRLSDVFPDGRAIQLQNAALRARYRNSVGAPELLEPSRIYCFEIDMSATANRFKAGHRLRMDVSSADFPKFDRNTNRGGEAGPPVAAEQSIYHDRDHPSHLLVSVLDRRT